MRRIVVAALVGAGLALSARADDASPKTEPVIPFPPALHLETKPADPSNVRIPLRTRKIEKVVIHKADGDQAKVLKVAQDPKSATSWHYFVDADGSVVQMVDDANVAPHAGNAEMDERSVGLQTAGLLAKPDVSEKQLRALAKLTRYLCTKYKIPVDRKHVIGHHEVPDPLVQGAFGGSTREKDPGIYFDWPKFMRFIREDDSVAALGSGAFGGGAGGVGSGGAGGASSGGGAAGGDPGSGVGSGGGGGSPISSGLPGASGTNPPGGINLTPANGQEEDPTAWAGDPGANGSSPASTSGSDASMPGSGTSPTDGTGTGTGTSTDTGTGTGSGTGTSTGSQAGTGSGTGSSSSGGSTGGSGTSPGGSGTSMGGSQGGIAGGLDGSQGSGSGGTAAPAPSGGGGSSASSGYTIEWGDTLWDIAQANNMSVSQLLALSGPDGMTNQQRLASSSPMTGASRQFNPNLIFPGQQLYLPPGGSTPNRHSW